MLIEIDNCEWNNDDKEEEKDEEELEEELSSRQAALLLITTLNKLGARNIGIVNLLSFIINLSSWDSCFNWLCQPLDCCCC